MTHARLPWPVALMIVTLPFVQVGTIRAPVRLIAPDLIALAVAAGLACRWRSTVQALARDGRVATSAAAVGLFCALTIMGSLLSLIWITPQNFQHWKEYVDTVKWLGEPLERSVVENMRLLECAAAFAAILVHVNSRDRLVSAVRCYVMGATVAAVYGLYVWFVMINGSKLPLLPGTFAYLHLKRTAATFPEPAAYGGFALTGVALTLWLFERQREKWIVAVLGLQLLVGLTSLSTLLLTGLGLLWLASLADARRSVLMFTAGGTVAVLVLLATVPSSLIRLAIEKPLTTQASWIDRTTAWRAAAYMAAEYPAVGVGTGLYAFNQAPFHSWDVPTRFTGGRVNSPALEIAAESGLMGVICGLVVLIVAWRGAARGGHGVLGLRGLVILLVLAAGYYTSRYAFLWVFTALMIVSASLGPANQGHQGTQSCDS